MWPISANSKPYLLSRFYEFCLGLLNVAADLGALWSCTKLNLRTSIFNQLLKPMMVHDFFKRLFLWDKEWLTENWNRKGISHNKFNFTVKKMVLNYH